MGGGGYGSGCGQKPGWVLQWILVGSNSGLGISGFGNEFWWWLWQWVWAVVVGDSGLGWVLQWVLVCFTVGFGGFRCVLQ